VATTGDALPAPGALPYSEDQWRQWALTVFGGNHARASAAATAAAAARSAGASSDDLFAAARAAYNGPLATSTVAAPMPSNAAFADTTAHVVRPTGRSALGLSVAGILVVGIADVIARLASSYVAPVILVAALALGAWYALSLRCSVRIIGLGVSVQGLLHRRAFRRQDVRQITVQPRSRQLGMRNSALRGQFLASFVGDDFSHLFELRQGAWTRHDIERIGAALGVDVVEDPTPSVT
jgi:hypothetical protein